ncbi:hypothetical protein [Dyadobacter pollutisoli]|jgi:hypothetical protein|uniref:Uncharacterized protein n=1 Tax=Dyadobacter pollutisoli TaxID=2910158 RepID=A0A9E8SKT3_9BACT|nr:hypothetical protein [Dyadobacter pollutisoli]WAC12840.1 hypothetical protein ON006_02515 [Dyadobacter pollutisoli]
MKTESSSQDQQEQSHPPENQAPDPALLSTLAEELETDENIERLAKKLAKEWNEPAKKDQVPNLPFSEFLDKLKRTKDQ